MESLGAAWKAKEDSIWWLCTAWYAAQLRGHCCSVSVPGSFGSLTYGLDIFHRVQSNVLVFMFQFINEHGDGVQVGLVFLCSSHCTMCCLWRPGDVLCRVKKCLVRTIAVRLIQKLGAQRQRLRSSSEFYCCLPGLPDKTMKQQEYKARRAIFSFFNKPLPRQSTPDITIPSGPTTMPLKTQRFRMGTPPSMTRPVNKKNAPINAPTTNPSPRQRRHKLQVKYSKNPFSTMPIYDKTSLPTTRCNRNFDPASTASTPPKISRLQSKSMTPMGRAAQRFPPSKPPPSKPQMDETLLGESITAVKALTNGSQVVTRYLQTLWTASDDVCPRPIPPQMFNNNEHTTATKGGGLITIAEHQRVLAVVLRDYTNRLSVAYRSAMVRSENIASFRARELDARLQATLNAFRKTKEDSHQQNIFIDQLLMERNQLRTQVEQLEHTLRNTTTNSINSTTATTTTATTAGDPGLLHAAARRCRHHQPRAG